MLEQMGYDTAVDLDALIEIAQDLPGIVGHDVPGQVMKAGKADRKYPKPEWVTDARSRIAALGLTSLIGAHICRARIGHM